MAVCPGIGRSPVSCRFRKNYGRRAFLWLNSHPLVGGVAHVREQWPLLLHRGNDAPQIPSPKIRVQRGTVSRAIFLERKTNSRLRAYRLIFYRQRTFCFVPRFARWCPASEAD